MQSSTIIDLGRFSLSYGDGKRLDLPVSIGPVELGGQTYLLSPESTQVRLDISRPAHGYAFRMRFPIRVDGPCMRCLEPAGVTAEVDAQGGRPARHRRRGAAQPLRQRRTTSSTSAAGRTTPRSSPCPTRILCRPDCAGLCPVCGESLNDADPADHEHDTGTDPRWAKLDELKLD